MEARGSCKARAVAERESKRAREQNVFSPASFPYIMDKGEGGKPRGLAPEPKRRDPAHSKGATWKTCIDPYSRHPSFCHVALFAVSISNLTVRSLSQAIPSDPPLQRISSLSGFKTPLRLSGRTGVYRSTYLPQDVPRQTLVQQKTFPKI